MNSDNILVKLNNVGFRQNQKYLVEGVSYKLKKEKLLHSLVQMDLAKVQLLKLP